KVSRIWFPVRVGGLLISFRFCDRKSSKDSIAREATRSKEALQPFPSFLLVLLDQLVQPFDLHFFRIKTFEQSVRLGCGDSFPKQHLLDFERTIPAANPGLDERRGKRIVIEVGVFAQVNQRVLDFLGRKALTLEVALHLAFRPRKTAQIENGPFSSGHHISGRYLVEFHRRVRGVRRAKKSDSASSANSAVNYTHQSAAGKNDRSALDFV